MNRRSFFGSVGLTGLTLAVPFSALAGIVAKSVTQSSLLAAASLGPKDGDWVRLILGTGVVYQKQIGVGLEATETSDLRYYETQVGLPGGSCNPNTMKRTYLKDASYGPLLEAQPVIANVADSGTTMTRWADVATGQPQSKGDASVRLLDVRYLYDDRPLRIVSSKKEMMQLPAPIAYAGSEDASRGPLSAHETTHVVAQFVGPSDARHLLTHVEMWTTPAIPFGLAKFRAYPKGLDPFDMHVFSYGTKFKSAVAMTLKTIRAMTPDGTYVDAG